MGLKNSRYNFFFESPDDDYILAYNAFSNIFARDTKKRFKIIKEILRDPNHFSYDSTKKKKLKKDLLKGKFLIDEEIDEVELLKMQNRVGRFSTEILGLTIAPTLNCNFKCIYCFEQQKRERMSKAVEEKLAKFVEMQLSEAKSLSITWFGGEPTLELNTIERLSEKFIQVCEEKKIEFQPASMISNGYLLTKKNAERIKKCNINRVQVTVDGIPSVHDKRRPLLNGDGTFERIITNIKEARKILQITIRINVDKKNIDKLDAFYECLDKHDLLRNVPFYFGHVEGYTEVCSDISSQCLQREEYAEIVLKELEKLYKLNVRVYTPYPTLMTAGFCGADRLNAYVVTPSGTLFKCWNEVTSDKRASIGSLVDKKTKDYQLINLVKYLNWEPYNIPNCVECKYLPICHGGCPYMGLNLKESTTCFRWKSFLEELLKLKYQEIKKQK